MAKDTTAKLVIEVVAGVLPGTPEEEYTRKWVLTSDDWAKKETQAERLAEINGQAQGYAGYLMLQPQYLNWVRTDWLWL